MPTILIIEDHAISRRMLKTLLAYMGHRVLESSEGSAALALARLERPDLIISDIVMPNMDGLEFARLLRADEELKKIPVLFYTATYRVPEARRLVSDFGTCRVITKPSDPPFIIRTVNEMLGISLSEEVLPRLRHLPQDFPMADSFKGTGLQLATLMDLNFHLVSQRDPMRLLEIFCCSLRSLLHCGNAYLALIEENGETRYFTGNDAEQPNDVVLSIPVQQIHRRTTIERSSFRWPLLSDTDPESGPSLCSSAASLLAVPLVSRNRVYGWACVSDKRGDDRFSDEDEEMAASLSAQAAVAYENIILSRQLQQHVSKLRDSEERLSLAIQCAGMGTWDLEIKSGHAVWSPTHYEILGYPVDESGNATVEMWRSRIHPDDLEGVYRAFETARIADSVYAPEYRIIRADNGKVRWLSVFGRFLKDEAGEIVRSVGVFFDNTKRKLSEQALEEQARLLDLSNDAISVRDADNLIMYWNKGASEIYGYSTAEAIGRISHELLCTKFLEPQENIDEALRRDDHWSGELIHTRKDGSKITVMSRWSLARDGQGRITSILESNSDVTGRKQAEEERRKLTEELRRSNAELEQFAYIASHDLQSPLRTVEGFVKMLARRYKGKLDPKADEIIEYISTGVQSMQELILDVLEFSKVQNGNRKFKKVNTYTCFQKALVNLGKVITEKQARIDCEELPVLSGDAIQLSSLFQNLIGNAIKFAVEIPEIHVGVKRQRGEYVFSVRDNGIGIEQEYLDRIFNIFHRLHGKGQYPGTGIGLAICKRIVERHGGRIWVKSEPHKGSTFFFTVPDTESHD